jgi:hypothetical protein
MSYKMRVAALACLAFLLTLGALEAEEPQAADGKSPPDVTSLSGLKCQIWTIREGEDRKCMCYEGILNAIDKKNAIITGRRSRLRRSDRFIGIEVDHIDEWKPLDDAQITLSMDKVDYIRFLK